jgi:ribonuclease P protein component
VVRNRWKRLLREAFRLEQHNLPPGVDFVLIPRLAVDPSLGVLRQSLLKLSLQAQERLAAKRPDLTTPAAEGS